MKKIPQILYLLLFVFQCSFGQDKIIGLYENGFGEKLILKSDYTFEYYMSVDLASSWNIGTWKLIDKKNIVLETIEVKDSVEIDKKIELVLSNDKISNKITLQQQAINGISGGGQSRNLPPKKLLIERDKLYTYSKENKIQKKKLKSIMDGTKLSNPWFQRK